MPARLEDVAHQKERSSGRTTDWMDGLRGYAAIAVFNFHYFFAFTDSIMVGYGADAAHRSVFSLPFVRVLAEGGTAVAIFFTVSGYVCSIKTLSLLEDGNAAKALTGLASSVFRRFFRLYLPVYCISLIRALTSYLGLLEYTRPLFIAQPHYFTGPFSEKPLRRCDSLLGQLVFWAKEMATLSSPFRPNAFYAEHDPHLWTIQYEFRMSLHLYMVLLTLALFRARLRLTLLIVIGLLQFGYGYWEAPLFFFGAALAQMTVLKASSSDSTPPFPSSLPRSAKRRKILRTAAFTLAVYLMTYPMSGWKKPSPGYAWMNPLLAHVDTRRDKLPKTVGILILMFLLTTSSSDGASVASKSWQSVLTSPIAKHLGSVMFAFYLVHGPVLHTFGYGVPKMVWLLIGDGTSFARLLGIFIGWAFNLVICLVLARFFHDQVERKCVQFTQWLERRLT